MSEPAPTDPAIAVAEAAARSRHARERLFATLGQVQGKLNPMALAQDAVENVAIGVVRDTVATVKARPRIVAAVTGAALLFAARRPLARLLGFGARRATSKAQASLKRRKSPSPSTAHPAKGSRP